MSNLNRFFASCLLIVSLSVVALADGGETQGPNIYSDQPTVSGPEGNPSPDTSSPILDALRTGETVAAWLLTEIF